MKISKNLHDRLRREVRNYNKRLTRLEEGGYNNLPSHLKVSEIISRYSNTNELIKEVNRISQFNAKKLEKKMVSEGVQASKWQIDFLKANTESAKTFFKEEYERVNKRTGRFPGERTYLDTISAKIKLLDKEIGEMNQSELRSAITAVSEFSENPSRLKAGYRGFLNEVEWVMDKMGYSEEQKDKFFNKFKKLTPTQFLYAYDNNDIIARVYSLYHKDNGEVEARLTVEEEDAEKIINSLLEQADIIVKDAQTNMV